MKRRVLRWYDYSWSRGRIQGGGDINTALGLLPDKLKTELALHVNLSVLKKVCFLLCFFSALILFFSVFSMFLIWFICNFHRKKMTTGNSLVNLTWNRFIKIFSLNWFAWSQERIVKATQKLLKKAVYFRKSLHYVPSFQEVSLPL